MTIDDEQCEALLQASTLEDNPEYSNAMPNITMLEKLFDLQNKFKRPANAKIRSSSLRYEVVNLDTRKNTQNINLGTNCTHAEK